jgi:alginate O-acetyltransferase complex protein AlgI
MLFNSYQFVFVFLPVSLIGYFILGRFNRVLSAAWLAFASIVFYGYWSPKYVPLLLGSVAFNFISGRLISRRAGGKAGKTLLIAAITVNLLLLGFYKYLDFFLSVANDAIGTHLALLRIVLPIGISFFTFTQIAFLVDAYRGLAREYNFVHYLLFATYFPHLIAGPILHHAEIMPQFSSASPYRMSARSFGIGLTVFGIGLAKKVLVADPFGDMASGIFSAAHGGLQIRLVAAWVGVMAYTFQLYFDFSGYSDMAIGIARLFGIDLPINFFSPYKSTSIIQFWQRWHMTLSRFLRDYLYFPLGGNRKGKLRRYANLMITMLLGGLWHGANYTFLIWGGLHGCYLMANHAWRAVGWRAHRSSRLATFVAGAITVLAVVVAWVFFRAEDMPTAFNVLSGMAGANGIAVHDASSWFWLISRQLFPGYVVVSEGALQHLQVFPDPVELVVRFVGAAIILWAMPNTRQITERIESACASDCAEPFYRYAVPAVSGVLLVYVLSRMQKVSTFLYFQF